MIEQDSYLILKFDIEHREDGAYTQNPIILLNTLHFSELIQTYPLKSDFVVLV